MNLEKLFEMQKVLDERIVKQHNLPATGNLDWKILALQVELVECANEWRGFKKWSNDQEPRTEVDVECTSCDGTGDLNYEMVQEDAEGNCDHEYIDCDECDCTGVSGTKNPLLEEYVDCLHFILSIGLELQLRNCDFARAVRINDPAKLISDLMLNAGVLGYPESDNENNYPVLVATFKKLGEILGFTWDQVEAAYMEKNAVNHVRQAEGY